MKQGVFLDFFQIRFYGQKTMKLKLNDQLLLKKRFWKTIRMITPVVMAESARLNTGLKKINVSPPLIGIHSG